MNVNSKSCLPTVIEVFQDTPYDVLWSTPVNQQQGAGELKFKIEAKNRISSWLKDIQDENTENIENVAKRIFEDYPKLGQRNLRYRFKPLSSHEDLAKIVFSITFASQPEKFISLAQQTNSKTKNLYLSVKNICWIQIPKAIAAILNNTVVKIAIVIGAIILTIKIGYDSYEAIEDLVMKSIPFVINHIPVKVFQIGNMVIACKDVVANYPFEICVSIWLLSKLILQLPPIPYVTNIARRVSFLNLIHMIVCSPQTIGHFLIDLSFKYAEFVWDSCTQISIFFQTVTRKAENERIAINKPEAYKIWRQEVKQLALS